jgi:soluble lytic murein transglycosylase-like protein
MNSGEFACLEKMWGRESGWDVNSVNSETGASGIAQFLPSTWADYGYDYFPRDYHVQIRAGLKYIKDRYGSPCAAWGFWQQNLWY